MSHLSEELLAAHVEHELSRLRGDALGGLIDERIAALFQWFEHVSLNDVATPGQIVGVIERYVIQLRVSGGITELTGEMANAVFSSNASSTSRVADVCEAEAFGAFADKVIALTGVQRDLIRYITQSSAFGNLTSRVLSSMITDLVFRRDGEGATFRAREVLSTVAEKLLPGLERRVLAGLARYVEHHAGRLTRDGERHLLEALDPEWVRLMADEIWDAVADKPLSEVTSSFSAQDLEDFVVLGYEFWLKFRGTAYFHSVCREVVDRLFVKYGDESLANLIDDMGVTEHMVAHEAKTFAAPLLEQAFRTGFLEQQLRAHLEPFYGSPAVAALLPR